MERWDSMELYEVSCGVYVYHAVAKTKEAAIKKVQEKHNLQHLAFNAVEIDLEGYKLVKR